MVKASKISQFTIILLCAVMLSACGDDAQKRYDRATDALQQAREQRDDAQQAVQNKQKELDELQSKQNDAQSRLDDARKQLQEAKDNVDKNVNDEVLFRTLQRKLLDQDRFGDSAIAVGVSKRVVTLTGTVPDQATHDKALKIANKQSGVKEVVDFLEIENKQQTKSNESDDSEK